MRLSVSRGSFDLHWGKDRAVHTYIAPVVLWTGSRSVTLDSTPNLPLGYRASAWCRRDEMLLVDSRGGKGRTTAVLSETSA